MLSSKAARKLWFEETNVAFCYTYTTDEIGRVACPGFWRFAKNRDEWVVIATPHRRAIRMTLGPMRDRLAARGSQFDWAVNEYLQIAELARVSLLCRLGARSANSYRAILSDYIDKPQHAV